MTNYILGIFAKHSTIVDKNDLKDIASNVIQIIAFVLFAFTRIFLDGETFKYLSSLLILVIIFLFIYSLFVQFKKSSTIPDTIILDFEKPKNLTTLEEGNLTSVSIGGLKTENIYSIEDKEAKIKHHSLQIKNIGIAFFGMDFEYKTRNFIVEYQPTFKDGLTEGILENPSPSLRSNIDVKITQIEFDNDPHPVTVNMCGQTFQTELPYMLVHIEYSKLAN